jgi:hypothetical protein
MVNHRQMRLMANFGWRSPADCGSFDAQQRFLIPEGIQVAVDVDEAVRQTISAGFFFRESFRGILQKVWVFHGIASRHSVNDGRHGAIVPAAIPCLQPSVRANKEPKLISTSTS